MTNKWFLEDIAGAIGVSIETMRAYSGKARMNRRNGTVRPGDLPEAAGKEGRFPYWEEATVYEWIKTRPGRGNYERSSK